MIGSIYVGMSGLQGFSKGLRVVSNNVTNLNTPGFKSATQQFGDMFYQNSQVGTPSLPGHAAQYGTGLLAGATAINFQAGEIRQTGNGLEVALEGEGFFVVDAEGEQRYTRAGLFAFDEHGYLVLQSTGHRVQGYGLSGSIGPISLDGLRVNPAKATSQVEISGNLSSTATEAALDGVEILDASGAEHQLRLLFKRQATDPVGAWSVEVSDGNTTLHTASVQFTNGQADESSRRFSFSYAAPNAAAQEVTIELSSNMTSFASGSMSSLVVSRQDGYASGSLAKISFDEHGELKLSYSNGQDASGPRLAIALFDDMQALVQEGSGLFASGGAIARLGQAGTEGRGMVSAGQVELSNVDLSAEFSNLILMQRGYKASSQIVRTVDEMIRDLFEMNGNR